MKKNWSAITDSAQRHIPKSKQETASTMEIDTLPLHSPSDLVT